MPERFFGEFLRQLLIAAHQVLDDDIHLDRELPLFIFHLAGFLDPVRILVKALFTFFFCPGKGSLILFLVIDAFRHAAYYFHFIDRLNTHPEI